MRVEQVKPYDTGRQKTEQVREMFDRIAPAYDFMNHAMTMGIDRWWRCAAVKALAAARPGDILDVATGTGDFAVTLYQKLHPRHIEGIDLSANMLAVARDKVARKGLAEYFTFTQGDCLELPQDDASVDAVTVAFGVRNFEDLAKGYRQMWRVLRPGGKLVVLELSTPRNRVTRWFYDLYTLHLIPWLGGLKSHDRDAYRYLPRSIAAVPQGDDMLSLMTRAGFTGGRCRRMTLGTCSLYTAIKPVNTPTETHDAN